MPDVLPTNPGNAEATVYAVIRQTPGKTHGGVFHPRRPLLLDGGDDPAVRVEHARRAVDQEPREPQDVHQYVIAPSLLSKGCGPQHRDRTPRAIAPIVRAGELEAEAPQRIFPANAHAAQREQVGSGAVPSHDIRAGGEIALLPQSRLQAGRERIV